MIVHRHEDELVLVTQPDHARFAAELIGLFRWPELARHPRRAALLVAIREHDNGWQEADAAPHIDPETGWPCGFRRLPPAARLEVWRRGVERQAADRPYSSLLVCEHALRLHAGRAADGTWRDFLAELGERRGELLAACGLTDSERAGDYGWLELGDAVSLAVAEGEPRSVARPALGARCRAGRVELDPFPLAGATTFRLPCRRIPARRYRGEGDLAGELAAARWQAMAVRCGPATT